MIGSSRSVSGSPIAKLAERRGWLWAVALLALGAAIFCALGRQNSVRPIMGKANRYVSLSPAITETVVALGASSELVGVSDYCHYPPQIRATPHVGSGYTPHYEAIVGLAPTLVFVESVNATTAEPLSRIVRVEPMPWLTLQDVIQSTRKLGKLTQHISVSEQLANAYESQLQPRVTPESPRVLLVMSHTPGEFYEVMFIRRNSIHGRVLEAAGARNAIDEDVHATPRLSLEQTIQHDPDAIIILQSAPVADMHLLDDWRRLTVLRAVQTNQIRIIAAPEVAIPGPRLLDLVKQLTSVIAVWRKSA
jgi:iron complex transport system substrate-binding protein